MYRQDAARPDRICIVCYRTLGTGEQSCGTCGAPLVPLDTPEVVAELRKRAKAKKDQPARRRYAFVIGASLGGAAIGFAALLLIGVVSLDRPGHTFSAVGDFWPFWLMFVALVAVTTSLVKWLRLFRMPQGGDTLDPETASVPELLVWLGLRV